MFRLFDYFDIYFICIFYFLFCEKNVLWVVLKLNQLQFLILVLLCKLCELIGDLLLVCGVCGMVLIQYGESFLKFVKCIFGEIECLFVFKIVFVLQEEECIFYIVVFDYMNMFFFIEVIVCLWCELLCSCIVIYVLGLDIDYVCLLLDGELDLVIVNWDELFVYLYLLKLFDDFIVCLMCVDCVYVKCIVCDVMSIEDYFLLLYVVFLQILFGYYGIIDIFFEKQNLYCNVVVELVYFCMLFYMVVQIDLVLMVGQQFVSFYEKFLGLKSYMVFIKFLLLCFYQLWYECVYQVIEYKWLCVQVSVVVKMMVQGCV